MMLFYAMLIMIGITGGSVALAVWLIRGNLRLKRELAAARRNPRRMAAAVKADHAAAGDGKVLGDDLKGKKDGKDFAADRADLSDKLDSLL